MKTLIYNVKNPPKRKIPKMRVPRSHHYTMIWPTDFTWGHSGLRGMAYINFSDSFLEDCVKRMAKHKDADKFLDGGLFNVMTACLN